VILREVCYPMLVLRRRQDLGHLAGSVFERQTHLATSECEYMYDTVHSVVLASRDRVFMVRS
jgi:hypothetical protein